MKPEIDGPQHTGVISFALTCRDNHIQDAVFAQERRGLPKPSTTSVTAAKLEQELGKPWTVGRRCHKHSWENKITPRPVENIPASVGRAQQSYCAGSLADWLHMGDVEECQ